MSWFIGKQFKFPKKNKVSWSQDFRYYSYNIPSGVVFTLDKILDKDSKRVVLRGKNYGDMKKNGYFNTSRYGNGSIFCDLHEILPYLIRSKTS